MFAFLDKLQARGMRAIRALQIISESATVPVGLTPREAVWQLNKATLYRYCPLRPAGERYRVPLLLVYALINKPYIFDLRPGRSFVEFMLEQGFDVYLLDWGAPGTEDRHTSFDDYAAGYLPRAVRKVLDVSGADECHLLGYCLGATIAVIYAARYTNAPIRTITLLAPPIDFSKREDSAFARWFDERYFDVDKVVASLGNIPVEMIENWSKLLKPVENYVSAYVGIEERMNDQEAVENWQAMHRWVHDGVPLAGEAFRQWVKDFVRANRLIRGEYVVRGQRIDLACIRAPLLTVIARHDHIVPPSHSLTIMDLVSSQDRRREIIPAGHVGLMGGRSARQHVWPKIAAWLAERSA